MRLRRPGDGIGAPPADLPYVAAPEWPGETVFILAGGPSLRGFDANVLRGRGRIVAIKESALLAPFADVLLFVDGPWYYRERALIDAFAGAVVTTATNAALSRCKLMRRGDAEGLAAARDTLNFSCTTVQAALNFVAHTGAGRGVLLGLDAGYHPGGPARHHDRNPVPPPAGAFDRQAAALATLVAPLRERGVEILNATPGSRLTLWPRIDLNDVLSAG
jgi:hypothetical protein